MNRYIYIFIFICFLTITTFILFEASGFTFEGLLQNKTSKPILAFISLLLLGIDVILPIPSSFIMISNGILFGFVLGGILSLVGGLISSMVGYFIGYKSTKLAKKFSSATEEAKARTFLEKYGSIAIIASRPIPVLAESVSIMSGTLQWSFRKILLNSFIGLLPISFVYSLTGAYSTSFNSAGIAFLINIGMAGFIWLITRWRKSY
jgi:uncharacterized membrane protein YdjX (TVP38/TMEM64 family)